MSDRTEELIFRTLQRLLRIEERLSAIEEKSIAYHGVWQSGQKYPRGAACTRDGSLWFATEETDQKPGNGATPWRLMVKNGDAAPPAKRVATQPRSLSPGNGGSGRRF